MPMYFAGEWPTVHELPESIRTGFVWARGIQFYKQTVDTVMPSWFLVIEFYDSGSGCCGIGQDSDGSGNGNDVDTMILVRHRHCPPMTVGLLGFTNQNQTQPCGIVLDTLIQTIIQSFRIVYSMMMGRTNDKIYK